MKRSQSIKSPKEGEEDEENIDEEEEEEEYCPDCDMEIVWGCECHNSEDD